MDDEIGGIHLRVLGIGDTALRVGMGDAEGTLHVDRDWVRHMVIGVELVVSNFRVYWIDNQFHVYALFSEGARIFMKACKMRGEVTVAEMFAGLAGWSSVINRSGMHTSIAVEKDKDTALCCAKKLEAPMLTGEQFVLEVISGKTFHTAVLWDDVSNPMTWVAVGLANVGMVVGSPPCPPWSSAANAWGLSCEDGACLEKFLTWNARLNMPVVILENVPGILKHADFRPLIGKIEGMGLRLMLTGSFNCKFVVPVNRERWLGTFVHSSVQIDDARVQLANNISFINHSFRPVAKSPSIDVVDVTHVHMSHMERLEVAVSQDALDAMGNIAYAPDWLKDKVKSHDPRDLVLGRVIDLEHQYKGFMAMYGSQHLLDDKLLRAKGLHTVIMKDDQGYRYFSPWEMLASMGYSPDTVLADDITKAWRMCGNGITSAHVWLALYKTHILLGVESPFVPMMDVCEQVQCFQMQAIHLSEYHTVHAEGFWMLEPIKMEEDDTQQDPKRRKCKEDDAVTIDSTVPFSVDAGEQIAGTKCFGVAPDFAQLHDPRRIAAAWFQDVGLVVVLQHCEKHWMMVVNGAPGDSVAELVTRGLPHARATSFHEFNMQGQKVGWNTVLSHASAKVIDFSPVSVPVVIHVPKHVEQIVIQTDVTWTVRTLLAYVACKLQCNPDTIAIQRSQHVLRDEEYLGCYEKTDFKITFKACMPSYVAWDKTATDVKDQGLSPTTPSCHRVVARHPMRKVIRTCTHHEDDTIAQVMQMLFPDLVAGVTWTPFAQGVPIDYNTKMRTVESFEVQWETYRPMQPTKVYQAVYSTPIDSPGHQVAFATSGVRLAIRSPLRVELQELWCLRGTSLAQIAVSFLQQTQANLSLICESGPRVLDPVVTAGQVDASEVISFRICPLLGGGKHEAVKTKLRLLLASKGVAEDQVTDRVNNLLSKVPLEHIAKYKDDNETQFWMKLKDDASDAKFRLISPAELKAFQALQRKSKPAASVERKPKKVMKEKTPSVDTSSIQVDMAHFKAGDHAVGQLETCRVGPDQTGVCIVPSGEADKYMNLAIRSCDPLAILIVGDDAHRFGPQFSLPAHLPNGDPVVVNATLKQNGEEPIEFALKLPATKVEQLLSTVIEFTILRDHVGNWEATAQALNYIGIHVPALRGSNLHAAWSIKSFYKGKKANHSQSDQWHGYLRVSDQLLGQVLQRSGSAGIFMVPKNDEKKRDGRFVAFPVPGKSVAELLTKAEAIPESLGVVKMGENFGIRCRREDAGQLRVQLSPESAYVEHASVGADENMYVLRNVPQVSREELTNALVRIGWEAQAVRAQGANRWLVSSKVEPKITHMIVNNNSVVVEAMHKKNQDGNLHMVASEVKINTVVDQQQGVMCVSTTSRFAEIRAQVEDQISAAVDQRLATANARIEELATTLQQVQNQAAAAHVTLANDVNMVKEEQTFTRNKLAEVEQSVSASGQAVITQMQSMFQTMEANMRLLVQGENEKEKRARTAEMPKSDPFSKA